MRLEAGCQGGRVETLEVERGRWEARMPKERERWERRMDGLQTERDQILIEVATL